MSVKVVEKRDARMVEYLQLHYKAMHTEREQTCRSCTTVFSYSVSDLVPSTGDYGGSIFFSPHIECPTCGTKHVFWFRTRLMEQWIGRYMKLRFGVLKPLLKEDGAIAQLTLV